MCINYIFCSFILGHLVCPYVLAVVHSAAMSMGVQILYLFKVLISVILGKSLESRLLGLVVILFLVF